MKLNSNHRKRSTQNQHTRELITARYTSHKHNNKDLDVHKVEFMYFVLTHMPGESYRRRLVSFLLCFCDVFVCTN